ncbi:putative copper-transporting ATPase HMA5 [Tetrabaena socialis]|uniref:Putative copper-transporting ATPase HMA5 n=1 Tax=Tetrabaena socialis TaxID=47790 RepID=A0A2J7ZM12_9CHLO|nr:putative copper-transporting ATPase HMA5 [Tetrabaena socialis]|eukprot:PNH01297.1 putative copper-transporting ATPase HMA5 [Tetrabaena socialis]
MQKLSQFLQSLRYEKLPEKEKDDREASKPQYGLATIQPGEDEKTRWPVALLSVKGMTCAACSGAVEGALSSVAGVKRVSVALLQESAELILGFPCNQLVKWALATPVQFVVGWRFHRGAFKLRRSSRASSSAAKRGRGAAVGGQALRRGTANMDVLVSMGTTASYLYSVISIMFHRLNRWAPGHTEAA